MLNYKVAGEYQFFERKRYNKDNIPTWKDVEFLFKNEEFKHIGSKITEIEKEQTIPVNVWEKMIKIFQYRPSNKEMPNLREEAIKRQPKIKEYMENGEIKTFEEFEYNGKSLLERTKDINVESYSSMYELFERGHHIGNCGHTSRFMGIMFENPLFHTGKAECLKGTKNSEDGGHAWIETEIDKQKYIIDTSMLLVIPEKLKEEIGYEDTKKAYTKKEYIDENDVCFNHYEIMAKYPTTDKFSYHSYTENIRNLEKLKGMERE